MTELSQKYGTRYLCYDCGTSFFDLNREKAICPRCGADQANRPKVEDRVAARPLKKETVRPKPEVDFVDETEDAFIEDVGEELGDVMFDDADEPEE